MEVKSTIILALILISSQKSLANHDGEFVAELTSANFHQAINDHKYLMVNFFSPTCSHCEALAPEYIKAAKDLASNGSDIKFATVDAGKEGKLADEYGIDGFPTLKFFVEGKPIEYSGGRQAEQISSWVVRKSGPAAKIVSSTDELSTLQQDNTVVVVGFLSDLESDLAKAFVETARVKEHITFAVLHDQSLFAGYNVSKDSVVIFKNFDEKDDKEEHFNGEANVAELSEFVQLNSIPLVVHFNYDYAPIIFGGSVKNHLLMFTSTKAQGFQQLKDMMTKLAKEYKGKLLFIFVDTDNEELKTISQFFGVTEDEMPGLRIVSLGQDMLKYKSPDNSFEEEKVKLFIKQFLAGELKPDLLSEEIPEDWDLKPVKTLVGKNFNSVVDSSETKTLVMFYAPWCGHCQSLVSIWEELGEHFKDSKDVIIAKMDSTKNEIEHVKIRAFPTIKLYLKGVDEVKDYNSIRTLEALLNFIKSDGMDGGAVDPDDDSYDEYDVNGGHDEL